MLSLQRNVYVISAVMALSFTVISMMVLISGLLGAAIAPDPSMATLPAAMLIVGTATSAIPAALWMQKVGRKAGMATGILVGLVSMTLAYFATQSRSFELLVLAMFLLGFNAACTQQGRFIILENSRNENQQADGLTLALMANLFAAVLGPWLGAQGMDMDTVDSSAGFGGSFLLAIGVFSFAAAVLLLFINQPYEAPLNQQSNRSIWEIARHPAFVVTMGSAAIGYGVMALIMTATPISMHHVHEHSIDQTRFVIQSHIVAMFLPSMLSGFLVKRGFRFSLLFAGLGLYGLVVTIGYGGIEVVHYWWALVLLGLGWNLLFLTSTAMLPSAYQESERFKAQALNDFLVFTTQALAAFAAGWLLFNLGWSSVLSVALSVTVVWGVILALLKLKLHRKS